ncbi:MAG: hydroxymethylbilane synthase [Treponema sp.]|jgi:hydroxymethylbilane synthase|nr:hydroxymethylbilane synthase [Treponema sp.]
MKRIIRVGSRDSVLAVKQAQIVMDAVKRNDSSVEFELVKIKTTGDKLLDRSLVTAGGKGLFIKELEKALADLRIDIAVHSYKDMPCEEADDLPIAALSERESPFDALVLPLGHDSIDKTKPAGSSSLRRTIQFLNLYKGLEVKPIRGNVPGRLSKLDNGEYGALILAHAGLIRLGLQNRVTRVFTVDEMIPSASQGILAVQGRKGEDYSYLAPFHNRESDIVSKAERRFIKTIGGGCSSPAAVYARINNNEILLTGLYADADGHIEKGEISGDIDKSEMLGETLAVRLKERAESK